MYEVRHYDHASGPERRDQEDAYVAAARGMTVEELRSRFPGIETRSTVARPDLDPEVLAILKDFREALD
jgi:hypothetical protein